MTATVIRKELAPLPRRLRALPLDDRGYPVPWFVAWFDGKPEFRAMDPKKFRRAIQERRCWVCGDRLGRHLAFVLGPMCGINRTSSEPPCHLECAEWSAQNCPFLARPHMVRREDALTDQWKQNVAGTPIERNPGVALVWVTQTYRVFNDGAGKPLIHIGDPERISWWAAGRPATREEVQASVDSGLPLLFDIARQQDQQQPTAGAERELLQRAMAYESMYPAAAC